MMKIIIQTMKGRQRKVQGKKLKRLKLNQDKVGTQGRENRRRKHEGKRRLHTSRSSSVSRWQITRNLRAEWRSSNQVQPLSFVAWWTEGVVFYLSKRGSVASQNIMTDERLTHTQRKKGQRKWKVTERITRKEVLHTTVLNLYSVLIQHNQSCLFTRFVPL